MNEIYRTVGISKQGFHKWLNRWLKSESEKLQLRKLINKIRIDHPTMSARDMYLCIQPKYMGRDKFERFCFSEGFRSKKQKNYAKTTNSNGLHIFPNLIYGMEKLTGRNQLWVSDITYYYLAGRFYYLTFIVDVYNREIVGYKASESLFTEDTTIPSLKMAIKTRNLGKTQNQLVFHSDGGGQYYCKQFLEITKEYGILNSMAESVYENPIAERINGVIKNNYLKHYNPQGFSELTKLLTKAVRMYNEEKPHKALGGLSPKQFLSNTQKQLSTKSWVINKKKKVTKKEKVYYYIN